MMLLSNRLIMFLGLENQIISIPIPATTLYESLSTFEKIRKNIIGNIR